MQSSKLENNSMKVSSQLKKFNFASPAVFNIRKIDWDLVTGISISDSGASGVIFIETLMGSFAVKGSTDPAVEYFGTMLMKKLGILVPDMEVYEFITKEAQDICDNLKIWTSSDPNLQKRVESRLNVPCYLIMEYVASNTIGELWNKKASILFDGTTELGKRALVELGRIVGTDTLLNMVDRYPLIWSNDGNDANILFGINTKFDSKGEDLKDFNNTEFEFRGVFAIDNRPFMFAKKNDFSTKNYETYLKKLENLSAQVFDVLKCYKDDQNYLSEKHPNFEFLSKLTEFIKLYTGYSLSPLDKVHIITGIAIAYLNALRINFDDLKETYQNVMGMMKANYQNSWTENLSSLNLEMLQDTRNSVKHAIDDTEVWISYFESIGFSSYIVNSSSQKETDNLDESKDSRDLLEMYGISETDILIKRESSKSLKETYKIQLEFETEEMKRREAIVEQQRQAYIATKKNKPVTYINK